jgi:hypothetical protein
VFIFKGIPSSTYTNKYPASETFGVLLAVILKSSNLNLPESSGPVNGIAVLAVILPLSFDVTRNMPSTYCTYERYS